MKKRLTRSADDRVILGVLGGISAYLGWNSLYLRIVYALLIIASFHFSWLFIILVALYVVAAILMPRETSYHFPFWKILKAIYSNHHPKAFTSRSPDDNSQGRKILHHVKVHDIKK